MEESRLRRADSVGSLDELLKSNGLHRDSNGIIIRAGGRVWTSPRDAYLESAGTADLEAPEDDDLKRLASDPQKDITSEHRSIQDNPSRKPFPKEFRGWQDALKSGAIVGIAMGCIAMVLFHQLGTKSTTVIQASTPFPASATPAVQALAEPTSTINLPGMNGYILTEGPFSSEQRASAVRQQLQVKGQPAVLANTPKGWEVWREAAMEAAQLPTPPSSRTGASHSTATSESVGVKHVYWSSTNVPVSLMMDGSERAQLNQWIAAQISALRTITSAIHGQTPQADALQAVSYASHVTPPAVLASQKGYPGALKQLAADIQTAGRYLAASQTDGAEQTIVDAWVQLQHLQNPD